MNGQNTNLTPWVTEKFISAAPSAAAEALAGLTTHEAVLLLKPLKTEQIVAGLNPMNPSAAAAILRRLPSRQAAHVLSRLEVKQAGAVFAAFSVPQREKMKTLLDVSFVKALEQAPAWPEDSAGGLMSGDFLIFRTESKLSEIVDKLKTLPRKKLPGACLVVSKDGKLKGFIRSAELAFYAPVSTAGSVMTEVRALHPETPAEEALALFSAGQPLVPVTDQEGVPLGVLTPERVPQKTAKKRFGWF